MKILKIFGIVVGIHVFALVLIFANPGCSSSSKTPPAASETVAKADTSSAITVPTIAAAPAAADAAPSNFNPDAPASAASSSGGVRFTPTRPNTPAATTLVAEPVKDVTPMSTLAVKSGDSLWSIAKKNNISVQDLATANNLKTNAVLKPGQKLIVPGKNPSPATTATTTAAPAAIADTAAKSADASNKPATLHHTVKSGETLGTIAVKYGVRTRDLAIANNITDPLKLPLGKDLIIPGWDAANGKAPAKSSGKSSVSKSAPAPQPSTPLGDQSVPVITSQPASQPAPQSDIPVLHPSPKSP